MKQHKNCWKKDPKTWQKNVTQRHPLVSEKSYFPRSNWWNPFEKRCVSAVREKGAQGHVLVYTKYRRNGSVLEEGLSLPAFTPDYHHLTISNTFDENGDEVMRSITKSNGDHEEWVYEKDKTSCAFVTKYDHIEYTMLREFDDEGVVITTDFSVRGGHPSTDADKQEICSKIAEQASSWSNNRPRNIGAVPV